MYLGSLWQEEIKNKYYFQERNLFKYITINTSQTLNISLIKICPAISELQRSNTVSRIERIKSASRPPLSGGENESGYPHNLTICFAGDDAFMSPAFFLLVINRYLGCSSLSRMAGEG
jgi:hypothetical protein